MRSPVARRLLAVNSAGAEATCTFGSEMTTLANDDGDSSRRRHGDAPGRRGRFTSWQEAERLAASRGLPSPAAAPPVDASVHDLAYLRGSIF